MAYKHGVYGVQMPYSGALPLSAAGTIPAYIGTAPIHQMNTAGTSDFSYEKYINKPILIESYADAKEKLGYSADWASFTLCEAVSAHFLAPDAPIGPIVCVNMADPSSLAFSETTATVTLTGAAGNKTGYLEDPLAAIENIALSGSLTKSDYTMSYVDGKIKVNITKSGFSSASVTATYKKIDVSTAALTADDFSAALDGLDVVEPATGVIPNILAAPGFSQLPAYHAKLIEKATAKLAQKWYAIVCSDIPCDTSTNNAAKAAAWKTTNGYDSKLDKLCWPMVIKGTDKYHLSTLAVVDMQTVDASASGVPCISPSNKKISADAAVLADGTEVYIPEAAGNTLNASGITTVNIVRGALRLWGPHMANYNYAGEGNIPPEYRQDTSVRMGIYMLNYLQYNYMDMIDMPISRRDVDSILASVQQWINGMVNAGQLLYGTVSFDAAENQTSEMINGNFVFNVQDTTAPNAKSLTFRTQYTTKGISTLTGGETA